MRKREGKERERMKSDIGNERRNKNHIYSQRSKMKHSFK